MNLPKLLAIGAAVCLVGAARADDKVDYAKKVVGKWEVTKADPGTLPTGMLVEFTRDGKIKFTMKGDAKDGALEGTYTVEGDKFTIAMKIGDMEQTNTITITGISDTGMTTADKDGKKVDLTKQK